MLLSAFGIAAAAIGGYVYRSSQPAVELPEAQPPTYIYFSDEEPDFSVTSYNVLARKYALYIALYTSPRILQWKYRRQLFDRFFENLHSDLVCL